MAGADHQRDLHLTVRFAPHSEPTHPHTHTLCNCVALAVCVSCVCLPSASLASPHSPFVLSHSYRYKHQLKDLFHATDKDGTGTVNFEEFRDLLLILRGESKEPQLSDAQISDLFRCAAVLCVRCARVSAFFACPCLFLSVCLL